ncbi:MULTISPECIES: hypothetical protein [unclassified Paenibacillus]|uniref:hypothetical protein n=1 Tax=unclassified Paenibacillus TaxID=185978 RepID=UPI00362822D1
MIARAITVAGLKGKRSNGLASGSGEQSMACQAWDHTSIPLWEQAIADLTMLIRE